MKPEQYDSQPLEVLPGIREGVTVLIHADAAANARPLEMHVGDFPEPKHVEKCSHTTLVPTCLFHASVAPAFVRALLVLRSKPVLLGN